MPQFLGCLVKCFYFVWSKLVSACQKSPGKGAFIAVPTWWAVSMAKVGIALATSILVNGNVVASTESRSIMRTVVYGVAIVVTMLPCLRQFHRRPSWLVNQREKECLGIISIPVATAVTCWENKKSEGWSMNRLGSKIPIYTDKKRYWYY